MIALWCTITTFFYVSLGRRGRLPFAYIEYDCEDKGALEHFSERMSISR